MVLLSRSSMSPRNRAEGTCKTGAIRDSPGHGTMITEFPGQTSFGLANYQPKRCRNSRFLSRYGLATDVRKYTLRAGGADRSDAKTVRSRGKVVRRVGRLASVNGIDLL